jgi:hypothetical protein
MSPRSAARLAWSIWAVIVVLLLVFLIGGAVSGGEVDVLLFAFVMFVAAFSTVGALVSSRLPRNSIGWIMLGAGVSYIVGGVAVALEERFAHDGPYSLAERLFTWVGSWAWSVGLGLAGIYLLLLFPNGRALSPRWKIVGYSGAAGMALLIASIAFTPDWEAQGFHGANPMGLRGAEAALTLAGNLGGLFIIGSVGAAAVSLFLRFHRSSGIERQQLKWLAFASCGVAASVAALVPIEAILGPSDEFDDISNLLITTSFTLVPIAIGVAVLRYRLYAIDRIINKTLVFGLVTALLVVGYAGGVLLMQSLLPVPDDSPVTVAVSTLAMAALFRPLRRRVQSVVDRRFYRARYDATQAIESFGSRLKHETDLESLAADLVGVVTRTMHPAHASLWLATHQAVGHGSTPERVRTE